MALHILIGGVDVSAWYKPGSFRATERTGQDRTSAGFALENYPGAIGAKAAVEVWESPLMRWQLAGGRVNRPKEETIGAANRLNPGFNPDAPGALLEATQYTVEVVGWSEDIRRIVAPAQRYIGKTTGFIFRDQASYLDPGFDLSSVDPLAGRVLDVYEVRQKSVAAVFDDLARLEGRQWWVGMARDIHFEDPAAIASSFDLTDENFGDLADDSLVTEVDTDGLANTLLMEYRSRYDIGQVDVFNAGLDITGFGTLWSQHVIPGARFRVLVAPNDPLDGLPRVATYGVQAVVDDDTITLSSPYNEITQASTEVVPNGPVDYVIDDIPRATRFVDYASREALAALMGGSGEFSAIIPDPGGMLDFREARDYLRGIAAQRANPTVNVSFKTNSREVPGDQHAGGTIYVQLTKRRIDAVLQVRELTKTDLGGVLADGSPLLEYTFRIEARLYDLASRLRREYEARGEASALGQVVIDEVFGAAEGVTIGEVSGIIEAEQTTETVTIGETSAITEVLEGPYVWAPGPAPPGSTVARWNRSEWQ